MLKSEDRERIVSALVSAAMGAARVLERDHIIPRQVVRVGEFVTQLRRELTYSYTGRNSYCDQITNKNVWEDILQPKSEHTTIDGEFLVSLAASAEIRLKETSPEEMKADLEQLRNMKNDAYDMMRKVDVFLKDADRVTEGFEKLAERM